MYVRVILFYFILIFRPVPQINKLIFIPSIRKLQDIFVVMYFVPW